MNDGFETPQGRLVLLPEDTSAQLAPVDDALPHGSGKRLRHRRDCGAFRAEQAMDLGIGIMDRDAQPAQQIDGDGFAHADRTGQADDPHQSFLSAMT